jgi:hypothetical protein
LAWPPLQEEGYPVVATGDFNKNGRVDVVPRSGVTLDGETVVSLPPSGSSSRIFQDTVAGDFNDDGSPDVVMLTLYVAASTTVAELFHGDGPRAVLGLRRVGMGPARRTLGRQADRGSGASLSQRWMAPGPDPDTRGRRRR